MHERNTEGLMRRDQARREAEMKLGEMIEAAAASGVGKRSPSEVWADAERDATSD